MRGILDPLVADLLSGAVENDKCQFRSLKKKM